MADKLSNLFILGGTRSGTSAIQIGILSNTRYIGNGEGHFITIYDSIMKAVDDFYNNNPAFDIAGTTAYRIKKNVVRRKIQILIGELYGDVFENNSFSDKTPNVPAIRLAPVFREIWPDCRLIYCRRRGIENIRSKIEKFPDAEFVDHCKEWSATITEWEQAKAALQDYLEIDQIQLARAPIGTAIKIGQYLGLETSETEALGNWFKASAAEHSPSGFAPVDFGEVAWSAAQRRIFVEICGDAMTVGKYTYDRTYWSQELPMDN